MIALLEAHRAGLFRRDHLWNNITAGIVVGIVAMPLAMAFAIASGATPAQGLYTAIVAGLALLRTAPRSDKALLLITFGLTVFVDLVVAVNVGVVIAALLFMRRMAESVNVQQEILASSETGRFLIRRAEEPVNDSGEHIGRLPRDTLVYRIDGPFFFGAAEKLESTLERVQLGIHTVVFRLDRVPFMDATGLQTFIEIIQRFQRHSARVMLCGIGSGLRESLQAAGILELVGENNVCTDLADVEQRLALAAPDTLPPR